MQGRELCPGLLQQRLGADLDDIPHAVQAVDGVADLVRRHVVHDRPHLHAAAQSMADQEVGQIGVKPAEYWPSQEYARGLQELPVSSACELVKDMSFCTPQQAAPVHAIAPVMISW